MNQISHTANWSDVASAWVAANLHANDPIPVFDETALVVRVRQSGSKSAGVLCRHALFDMELATITDTVRAGYGKDVEGMLYCLYELSDDLPVPMYVGIAQASGRTSNLSSLFANARKKPRFDDYDGYHIGDLSTQVVPGYTKKKAYKKLWASRMFSNAPHAQPQLRTRVYFWGKAWQSQDVSAVSYLGHTPLFLEEAVLVHALRFAFPGRLLNW